MEAVLYIGHGSRIKAGAEEAVAFLERTKQGIDVEIQETCFLELVEPDILKGIENCVNRGATKIAIAPVLLLTAMHANEDIPEELDKAKEIYPDIEFNYGRTFGVHPKLVEVLKERVFEQNIPIEKDAMVLLIGRGSSDPQVKQDLTEICDLLKEQYPFEKVEACYMYGATPKFEAGLQLAKESGNKQVFIIPYLLFSGILMNEITERIESLQSADQTFILCDSLGYHPNVEEVLQERVRELLVPEKITT